MKKLILLLFCTLGMLACSNDIEPVSDDINDPGVGNDTLCLVTASVSEARVLMAKEDAYLRNLTPFDLSFCQGNKSQSKEELIRIIVEEVQEWSETDKAKIRECMFAINDTIRKYNLELPFPKEIKLVKSPFSNAPGANGYTRSDWIALNMDLVATENYKGLQDLIVHELFHVLSRNEKEFRKKMYGIIGFTINDEELKYPEDLDSVRISNPDVERFDSYATFLIQGKEQKCAMTTTARKPYEGGSLFDYMYIWLIALDDNLIPIQKDGRTVTYSPLQAEDFWDKVGKNTYYAIDPEEIMAENFKFALMGKQQLPTPEIQERILDLIRRN